MIFNKKLWKILTAVTAALLAVFIALLCVGLHFAEIINVYLDISTQKVIPEEGAKIYYLQRYRGRRRGSSLEQGQNLASC